ncbi:hypothetical protein CBL_13659 [Carabus blaptoides fortunei]
MKLELGGLVVDRFKCNGNVSKRVSICGGRRGGVRVTYPLNKASRCQAIQTRQKRTNFLLAHEPECQPRCYSTNAEPSDAVVTDAAIVARANVPLDSDLENQITGLVAVNIDLSFNTYHLAD